ncbi:hypothetical protein FH609_011585 [Streptomyces sp. 3MP-14]|uniref:Uncharacterized protein n=1 Tax=Streptomyces mimosae TaxID=2586635 RepID=A0A5N6AHM8_9ACTN|nr:MULTISPECIES: hypothetical protein [Streptomyces]KAB8167038.1 hypothetical protein FH607_009035 [Streptomyces mimosae]KAB8176979.1 hypothetical protein FH609_011585 [Streptomyces sp. 3MP-14]
MHDKHYERCLLKAPPTAGSGKRCYECVTRKVYRVYSRVVLLFACTSAALFLYMCTPWYDTSGEALDREATLALSGFISISMFFVTSLFWQTLRDRNRSDATLVSLGIAYARMERKSQQNFEAMREDFKEEFLEDAISLGRRLEREQQANREPADYPPLRSVRENGPGPDDPPGARQAG